jgi:import inner membrane translocase subunit TIM22
MAGCLTGGGLAIKSGPQAALFGCGAFAAFSTAGKFFFSKLFIVRNEN